MPEILLKIRYFERGLSKALKKVNFVFFFSNPVPFNVQSYQKQKESGTSDNLYSDYETSSEKFLY